ncbi:immunoglobulin-like domain-containing protein [Paraglaciecola sp.]|uniref:immunoglobulin-like domain-containing protein n=1 Tax=Paraglaciecola sp. TaxID=1920173 RepID=UPI003EF1D9B7
MGIYQYSGFVLVCGLFIGCGGSSLVSTSPELSDPSPDNKIVQDSNNTQPEITLLGERVVILSLGQNYNESGAKATDQEDGDLSASISIVGAVNTQVVADYLLRYQVTDLNGAMGEANRIVRVFDSEPVRQSYRQPNNTPAELGYIEHLPKGYNSSVNYSAPLIIFNHGSGATGSGNLHDVECCGLPAVINFDSWDTELPFVILSPHRKDGLDTQALDDFIEYALINYQVDSQRIYLAGWSQGANISLRYMTIYPHKVAAVVPIAGGWFQGVPGNVCDAADVPMWSFVGTQDSNLITNTGITAANAINGCNPSERAKLTNYLEGTHFTTSLWPFLPSETHSITGASDRVEPDLFQWLQQQSK